MNRILLGVNDTDFDTFPLWPAGPAMVRADDWQIFTTFHHYERLLVMELQQDGGFRTRYERTIPEGVYYSDSAEYRELRKIAYDAGALLWFVTERECPELFYAAV